ncbi:hypothetical protein P4O66_001351 [Electrophorus voltai]|uniref:Uncharacterized protein n=1 Tax=Electrophorus voltai TaxID=2609070 RepID=A0AAD8Z8P8_9TELE|nr:hypothetical protein P4O66_001351 [Electrophorus voltai]
MQHSETLEQNIFDGTAGGSTQLVSPGQGSPVPERSGTLNGHTACRPSVGPLAPDCMQACASCLLAAATAPEDLDMLYGKQWAGGRRQIEFREQHQGSGPREEAHWELVIKPPCKGINFYALIHPVSLSVPVKFIVTSHLPNNSTTQQEQKQNQAKEKVKNGAAGAGNNGDIDRGSTGGNPGAEAADDTGQGRMGRESETSETGGRSADTQQTGKMAVAAF